MASSDFIVVDDLPSGFRLYPNLDTIKVRGLTFSGILNTTLFLTGSASLKQLAVFYKDFIILEAAGDAFPIESLEPMDFHYLMIISSLLTEEQFHWNLNMKCSKCKELLTERIEVSEITYDVKLPGIGEVKVTDTITACPLTVKSKSAIDEFERLYTLYTTTRDGSNLDIEAFKFILRIAANCKFSSELELMCIVQEFQESPKLVKKVKNMINDFSISLNPVKVSCGCGKVNDAYFDFNSLRGYL